MYSTELMEQILTSEIGQQIIQRVTNKYGNSYVGLWLFQIIGMSNDEVKAMVEDFKNQTLPQTATWSLSSMVDEESVRKKIKLIKQSHKVFDIFYEQATKGDIYVGGVIQKSKEITLEEV